MVRSADFLFLQSLSLTHSRAPVRSCSKQAHTLIRLLVSMKMVVAPHNNTAREALVLVLFTALVSTGVSARKLPPGIKACSRNDPKLEECAARNANAAIPYIAKGFASYGIPPMDPLHVPIFNIDDTGSRRQVAIELSMRNLNITGLRRLHVDKLTVDLKSRAVSWSGSLPRLEIIGDYEIGGRVLVLPIRGKGDLNFTLENVQYKFSAKLKDVGEKGGSMFVSPVDNDLFYNTTHCYMLLDNLFGDKNLSRQMNIFLNENWREIMEDLGPALGEILNVATQQVVGGLTKLVPFEDIFVDTPAPSESSE